MQCKSCSDNTMSGLSSIPVQVETPDATPAQHGNAIPILHEVRHALARLIERGEPTQIDLNAIPFGPGDEERLTELLGTGEVEASIRALGPTHVRETAIPGVWLVDYYNDDGQRLALHLEIATIPEILRVQPDDLSTAAAVLDARLTPDAGDPRPSS
jgi:hydrogenase-1 operon protein HyaF